MSERPILGIIAASEAPSQDTGRLSPAGLMAEAAAAAADSVSFPMAEIDGLLSASAVYYMPTLTLAEHLGIRPTYSDSTTMGGCSFIAHLRHAAAAIEAGLCTTALVAYGSTQRSDGGRYVRSMSELLPYEVPYGPRWPIAGYAMRAQRHMHEFGTTPEQLAEVAVAARAWAVENPAARASEPLTVEDVLSSPMISSPLHRLDCCLVTDAAGALLVTSPERAADLCDDPVYVLGAAESHDARYISGVPDFTSTPGAVTGPAALGQAGLDLKDIDVFQTYDAFTISTLLALEDLGLCAKGDGGPFVEEGHIRPGGSVPLNTNGGGLSYRHGGMLGMTLLVEAVAQLSGTATGIQVEGCRTALVHGIGGVQTAAATAVLGTADALDAD